MEGTVNSQNQPNINTQIVNSHNSHAFQHLLIEKVTLSVTIGGEFNRRLWKTPRLARFPLQERARAFAGAYKCLFARVPRIFLKS